MGKYDPLAAALRGRDDDIANMTFTAVAALVGGLPASAYRYRPWWANSTAGNNAHSPGWLAAGWRVDHVDLARETVRFTRLPPDAALPPALVRGTMASPAPGLEPTGDRIDVRVETAWMGGGEITLDREDKPVFAPLPSQPGIYRMVIELGGVPTEAYIGETDNLRRRTTGNYRNPSATQQTSTRINAWLRRQLADGATVRLDVAVAATVTITETTTALDLNSKPARLLVENAALVETAARGVLALVNL